MLLTEDQEQIRDAVRAFAQAELWPHAARWDQQRHFPHEAHRGLAALGAYGICVPEELGGANLDYVTLALVLEEIAAGDGGVSPNSQHHQGLAADVRVAGLAAPQVYQIALRLHSTSQVELGGLGFYASQDFVHVDLRQLRQLRQPGRLRTWDGDAPR